MLLFACLARQIVERVQSGFGDYFDGLCSEQPRSQSSLAIIECDVTRQADREHRNRFPASGCLVARFARIARVGLGTTVRSE